MKQEDNYYPYYLYLHKTLESTPFYIGIGTKCYGDHRSLRMRYARAYDTSTRSEFWKKVVNKYGYNIEILIESQDYEYIKEQEIEFIKLYGRRDLGLGTLVNLTDGGDGTLNTQRSEASKKQSSESHKKLYLEGKSILCKPGFYDGHSERMKNNQYAKGKKLTKVQIENLIKKRVEKYSKQVIQEDLQGTFIKEWFNSVEVAKHFSITKNAISKACINYDKGATSKGYRWKFK